MAPLIQLPYSTRAVSVGRLGHSPYGIGHRGILIWFGSSLPGKVFNEAVTDVPCRVWAWASTDVSTERFLAVRLLVSGT